MRILVAGGAGFIGSHLCTRLCSDDHGVVCADNFITGRRANIEHLAGLANFTFVEADIIESVPVASPIDQIFHLASPASPVAYQRYPLETLRANSEGTRMLLNRADIDGARLLYASTSEIYGDPIEHPQTETYWGNVNTVGPRSMYDESKRYGEAFVTSHAAHHGTDTRIARIFNAYGPAMDIDDGRVVSNFIVQALRGDPITIYGDGTQTRSFQFVEDLVEGLVRLMESGYAGPVNLGNPDEYTIAGLAREIIDLTDSRSEIVFRPLPIDDPKVRKPDISLALTALGWQPQIPLRKGLERTIPYFAKLLGIAEPAMPHNIAR